MDDCAQWGGLSARYSKTLIRSLDMILEVLAVGDALGRGLWMCHHRPFLIWNKGSKKARSVPRYFFTIRRRCRVEDDPHGTNLPDIASAISTAEGKIRQLRKEREYTDPTLMMVVKDEAGQSIAFLPFFPSY